MKHKVDVLMAVYNPDLQFLKKQLESIDNQDYDNIELLIFDDCIDHRLDKNFVSRVMKKVKFRFLPYKEKNLGYVKAFETLVEESNSDICAFCDQDDIWMHDKISKCVKKITDNDLLLLSSDKQLIDENDKILCESHDLARKFNLDVKANNSEIGKKNFFGTFADGLCLVARTSFAKRCIPFSQNTGHDKWLIACACAENGFDHFGECLVQHRRHSNNVSGFLKGVESKSSYRNNRVYANDCVIMEIKDKYPNCTYIDEVNIFSKARIQNNPFIIFKYRKLAPKIAIFEFVMCFIPEVCFVKVLKLLKKFHKEY